MTVIKNPVAHSPASESSDSESLFKRLAKEQIANAHSVVNKVLLGDSTPLMVDNH
jgi:hypothetical protein